MQPRGLEPQLADLRSAAIGSMRGWQQAMSSMTACARLEMISACPAQQSRAVGLYLPDEVGAAAVVLGWAVRHYARTLSALAALRWLVSERITFGITRPPPLGALMEPAGTARLPCAVRRNAGLRLAMGHGVGGVRQRTPRLLLRRWPRLSSETRRFALSGAFTEGQMAERGRLRFP
jgi:hypothetical protein